MRGPDSLQETQGFDVQQFQMQRAHGAGPAPVPGLSAAAGGERLGLCVTRLLSLLPVLRERGGEESSASWR